jgi:DNA repair protein RadC
VLNLDAKNRVKGRPREVSRGLLDASLVHPREVFREAIRASSAAVVLVHNHPSGDPTPSAEDVRITRQLIEAGRIVDIRVLDHVVLAGGPTAGPRPFVSLREAGLADFER